MKIHRRFTLAAIGLTSALSAAAPAALAGADTAPQRPVNAWPMEGHDPHHSYTNRHERAITMANFSQMAVSVRSDVDHLGPTAAANGRVFVCSEGTLQALDAVTGAPIWARSDLPGEVCARGPVAVGPEAVFVGTFNYAADVSLSALRAADGHMLWSTTQPDPDTHGLLSPMLLNDVLVAPDWYRKVYAFDASTGARRWVVDTCAEYNYPVSAKDGVVVVGTASNVCGEARTLWALDQQTGAVLWRNRLGTNTGAESPPQIIGNRVIIEANDYYLYAFDLHSGAALWTSATRYFSGACASSLDRASLLCPAGSVIVKLDLATGQSLRYWTTGSTAVTSNVVVIPGGALFVAYVTRTKPPRADANLTMLDTVSGEVKRHPHKMIAGYEAFLTASGGSVHVTPEDMVNVSDTLHIFTPPADAP